VDARLHPAREHQLGVAAADRLPRLSDRVAPGGARGNRGEVGPQRSEIDRDLARAHVGDAHGNEERADPVGSSRGHYQHVVEQGGHPAKSRAHDDPGLLRQLAVEPIRKARLIERLPGDDEAELDVAVGPAQVLAVEHAGGVEVANLGGDLGIDPRGIEGLDPPDPGSTSDQAVPGRGHVVAERGDRAHAGHDHATRHRTSLPVRTVAAR
jgi:hypothetical protein